VEAGLKRGEIWTAAGAPEYAGKPRPFVIVQDEGLDILASVTVCGFTSDPTETPIFRVLIAPSDLNQLKVPSRIMVDKVTTIPATKLGYRIGRLDRALMIHLGLAR